MQHCFNLNRAGFTWRGVLIPLVNSNLHEKRSFCFIVQGYQSGRASQFARYLPSCLGQEIAKWSFRSLSQATTCYYQYNHSKVEGGSSSIWGPPYKTSTQNRKKLTPPPPTFPEKQLIRLFISVIASDFSFKSHQYGGRSPVVVVGCALRCSACRDRNDHQLSRSFYVSDTALF